LGKIALAGSAGAATPAAVVVSWTF
jgi:hypothetical protein